MQKIPARAEDFINHWVAFLAKAENVSAISESSGPQQLIRHREEGLKRGLSRFTNPRQREIWVKAYEESGNGAGDAQMDLRWNAARRILRDICSRFMVTFCDFVSCLGTFLRR